MPRAKKRMRLDLAGIRQQLDAISDDERSKYNLLWNSRRTIGNQSQSLSHQHNDVTNIVVTTFFVIKTDLANLIHHSYQNRF